MRSSTKSRNGIHKRRIETCKFDLSKSQILFPLSEEIRITTLDDLITRRFQTASWSTKTLLVSTVVRYAFQFPNVHTIELTLGDPTSPYFKLKQPSTQSKGEEMELRTGFYLLDKCDVINKPLTNTTRTPPTHLLSFCPSQTV